MDDDFEKWLSRWDAAQEEIAAELPKPQPQPRTSFFNNQPSELDYGEPKNSPEQDGHDWYDLYQRSSEVDYSNEGLLTESDALNVQYMVPGSASNGYGKPSDQVKPETGTGKKAYLNNPIHFASVGKDQGDDTTDRVRVTDNFSDGEELRELDDVKRRVEAMERRVHEADILKKNDRAKLQTELTNLRSRVRKLCEKIVPSAQSDMT